MLRWSQLFPHCTGLHVGRVLLTPEVIYVQAQRAATTAKCPRCGRCSRRVHSHYTRHLADEPVGGRRVELHLQIRRFRCGTRGCAQRTFAEQVPDLAARRARRTVPLQRFLQDVGLTIGGRPGARFAERRAITASRMTVLRLVRALPEPPHRSPRVLGVDDFALRRGYRYGTVLVDVAASEVVDVLPDRTTGTLSTWLAAGPAPQFICRDRAGEYASGAGQGAPDAIQIADRFHLARSSGRALEQVLYRHAATLRKCLRADLDSGTSTASQAMAGPSTPSRARAGRLARYEHVLALHQQGWSQTAIAAQVGLSQPTIRKYLRAGNFPEWGPRRTVLRPGTRLGEYLRTRWQAGVQDAMQLWQELRARGYRGTARSVQRTVAPWRDGSALRGYHAHRLRPPRAAPDHRPPSARQAAWLLLRPLDALTAEEQHLRHRVLAATPEIEQAHTAICAFRRLLRQRDGPALEPWLAKAQGSPVRELRVCGQPPEGPGGGPSRAGLSVEQRSCRRPYHQDQAREAPDVRTGLRRPAETARDAR